MEDEEDIYDAVAKYRKDHPEIMEDIRGALARAYCTKRNENKVLDPDLIEDMAVEVDAFLTQREARKEERNELR